MTPKEYLKELEKCVERVRHEDTPDDVRSSVLGEYRGAQQMYHLFDCGYTTEE